MNRGEHYEAVGSIAAPVIGPLGRPVAALSNGFAIGLVSATDEEKNKARRVAFLASRTNTMLSIPMLFFMSVSSTYHLYHI